VYDVFSVADTVSKTNGGSFDGNVTMAGTLGVTGATTLTGGVSGNTTFSGEIITSTSGTSNLRIGENAGDAIASGGNYNTVVGDEAGTAITTGDNNVAVGFEALKTEDTGQNNVAIGYRAMNVANYDGAGNNVAIGADAGLSMTTGIFNTFVGAFAGDAHTEGYNNVAIGTNALGADVSSRGTVAIGAAALSSQNMTNTDAYNVAVGFGAGADLTDGERNILIGGLAGDEITTADDCIAIGYRACGGLASSATTGHDNICIGKDAGESLTSGQQNTIVGTNSAGVLTTGESNIIIGNECANGSLTTGDANIFIGNGITAGDNNGTQRLAIGHSLAPAGDNIFTLGKGTGNDRVYNQFTVNASWVRVSDERYKTEITDNTDCGLAFINDLRPVTFKWKAKSEIDSSLPDYDASKTTADHTEKMYGLIAQEVKQALDNHNITDFGGHDILEDSGIQAISQEMFVHPLIKAVQELSAKVTALETENATQATQIADLISRVTALENAE
jgi:hypothetical protein